MAQVSFAEDDDMIKTFPPDRTNQSVPYVHSAMAIAMRLAGHESHRVKTPFKYLRRKPLSDRG